MARTPAKAASGGGSARTPSDPLRQPRLYWEQLKQLKTACIVIRLYRNRLSRRVRTVEVVKAVASSGGIAGWVVWRDIPFVWSGIIAAAQLLDALKHVFPFAKDQKAASELTVALDVIYIDAEEEWEGIHGGRLTEAEITKRRTRLRKLQHEAEKKAFPEGVEFPPKLVALAETEAEAYFSQTFG
jgi:hypothetical protein